MITETATSVAELHFDHEIWALELRSWREELKILEKYLTKIQHAKLNKDAAWELERFQNQLIRHREVLHDLINEASSGEKYLASNNDVLADDEIKQVKIEEYAQLKDKIETARQIYNDLKAKLREWLSNRL